MSTGLGLGVGPHRSGHRVPAFEKTKYPDFPKTIIGGPIRSLATAFVSSGWGSATDAPIPDTGAPLEDKPYGDTELLLQIPTTGNTSCYYSSKDPGPPVDVRNGNIVISLRKNAFGASNTIRSNYTVSVALYSDGTPAARSANSHSLQIQVAFGEKFQSCVFRQEISLPVSLFAANGTGADLSAITYATVSWKRSASTAVSFYAGDIYFQPNPRASSLTPIILRFDGGYISQYNVGFDALKTRFGGTAKALLHDPIYFIENAASSGTMNWTQVAEWVKAGGEFAPHNFTTDQDFTTEAEFTTEHEGGRKFMKAKAKELAALETDPILQAKLLAMDHTSSTGADYTSTDVSDKAWIYAQMRRKFYRMCLNFTNSNIPFGGGETFPPGDRWNLRCYTANAAWTPSADVGVTDFLNNARAIRGLPIIVFHDELSDPLGPGTLVFNTVLDILQNRSDEFYLTTPCELFDPYLDLYGSVP